VLAKIVWFRLLRYMRRVVKIIFMGNNIVHARFPDTNLLLEKLEYIDTP